MSTFPAAPMERLAVDIEALAFEQDDFRLLVSRFLRDRGYSTFTGLSRGADGGVDIVAEKDSRAYDVHLSAVSNPKKIVAKFKYDASRTLGRLADGRRVNGAFFFSAHPLGAINPHDIISEDLRPLFDGPFDIAVFGPDQIACELLLDRGRNHRTLSLLSSLQRGRTLDVSDSPYPSAVLDVRMHSDQSPSSTEELRAALCRYKPSLPCQHRWSTLSDIASLFLRTMWIDPTTASALTDDLPAAWRWEGPFLRSLVACGLGIAIDAVELAWVADALTDIAAAPDRNDVLEIEEAIAAILRCAFYSGAFSDDSSDANRALSAVASEDTDYWHTFLADVWLRSECNFISLSSEAAAALLPNWHTFRSAHPDSLLVSAGAGAVDPIGLAAKFPTLHDLAIWAKKAACRCTSRLEARWPLLGYLRAAKIVYPYDQSEGPDLNLLEVIECLPPRCRVGFASFLKIRTLLYQAKMTLDPSHIALAERELLDAVVSGSLSVMDEAAAKAEYVSVITRAIEERLPDEPGWNKTLFSRSFEERTAGPDHPLFSVRSMRSRRKMQPPDAHTPDAVVGWLYAYMGTYASSYASPAIARNPAKFIHYRYLLASTKAASVIGKQFAAYTAKRASETLSAEYAAQLTVGMDAFPLQCDPSLRLGVARRAIEAAPYTIALYAEPVAHVLYAIHRYCADASLASPARALLERLDNRLLDVPVPHSIANIYSLSPRYEQATLERDFLRSMGDVLQLDPDLNVDGPLLTHDLARQIASFLSKGSRLAMVVEHGGLHESVWNALGTFVCDHHLCENDFHVAAQFYRLATCMARQNSRRDTKYICNYVRVVGQVLGMRSLKDDTSLQLLARSACSQLCNPGTRHFRFKYDACRALFDAIDRDWDALDGDLRRLSQRAKESLEPRHG